MCRVDHETETVLQMLRNKQQRIERKKNSTIKMTKMATKTPIHTKNTQQFDTTSNTVHTTDRDIHWNMALDPSRFGHSTTNHQFAYTYATTQRTRFSGN